MPLSRKNRFFINLFSFNQLVRGFYSVHRGGCYTVCDIFRCMQIELILNYVLLECEISFFSVVGGMEITDIELTLRIWLLC